MATNSTTTVTEMVAAIKARPVADHVRDSITRDCEALIGQLQTLVDIAERAGRFAAMYPDETADIAIHEADLRGRIATIVSDVEDDRIFLHKLVQPTTHPELTR